MSTIARTPMRTIEGKAFLTIKEAARYLGVCERTVRRLKEQQKLRVTYITPDAPRYRVDDLVAYLNTLP